MRFLSILTWTIAVTICLAGAVLPSRNPAFSNGYTVRDLGNDYSYSVRIDDHGNVAIPGYQDHRYGIVIIGSDTAERWLALPSEGGEPDIIGFSNAGELLADSWGAGLVEWSAAGDASTIDYPATTEDNEGFTFYTMNNLGVCTVEHWYSYPPDPPDPFSDWISPLPERYTSSAMIYRSDGSTRSLERGRGWACNVPHDINDAGWVAGYVTSGEAYRPDGKLHGPRHYQAVLWSPNGTIRELKKGGATSAAVAISNAGEIAGRAASGPVVWDTAGRLRRKLPRPGLGTSYNVTDINDNGTVLGNTFSYDSFLGQFQYAVVWDRQGRLFYLPPLPGDLCTGANCINNAGEIVGWSSAEPDSGYPTVVQHLVVWTPVRTHARCSLP